MENAAASELLMLSMSAGAILSKNLARNITHTFSWNPGMAWGICYLNSAKITLI